jgi:hypothetical protein
VQPNCRRQLNLKMVALPGFTDCKDTKEYNMHIT